MTLGPDEDLDGTWQITLVADDGSGPVEGVLEVLVEPAPARVVFQSDFEGCTGSAGT